MTGESALHTPMCIKNIVIARGNIFQRDGVSDKFATSAAPPLARRPWANTLPASAIP